MSIEEYNLRWQTLQLSIIDKHRERLQDAFDQRAVNATKTVGSGKNVRMEYVYKKPEELYDFDKIESDLLGTQSENADNLRKIMEARRKFRAERISENG